jgi:thiol-disulfide isomerase/thioredoxin
MLARKPADSSTMLPTEFPLLLLILGLLFLGSIGAHSAHGAVRTGDSFPALNPAELDGQLPETAGRAVLVDFWASWCAPCRTSFPHYARLHADYAARGLVIIAVSVDEDSAAYAAFVRKFAPPFAVVRDKDRALVQRVDVPAMPTCFVLDANGRVQGTLAGYHGEKTDRELRQLIEQVLPPSLPAP